MHKKPYIESDRLIIRLAEKDDLVEVVDYHLRNKEYLASFEPKHDEKYFKKERWKKVNDISIKHAEEGKAERFFIFKKDDNKRVVGTVNFEYISGEPEYSCCVGYSIDEHEQGKGYMTEALKLSSDYILKEFNIMRIEGGYDPDNGKSGNVMRKVGFVGSNLIKKYIRINGVWKDIMFCYLYNDNWKEE
ncbi:30S ribosomal protein S5 alanine N-acetyltransferase [Vallitalea longa]|uniref:30S ribosomal protein S5 alanine N-acetyltransferase n=1 Tax=Vallitalea longa TaxID=2936439 RepID=A0A9W6DEH6_9FIRM|nr:GNAT family N-acetyltransferase [Vallitalea longa]GKX29535.1 30S ribosomal protein S5 alanine N-acetyltransferase [Vallitalea longa]